MTWRQLIGAIVVFFVVLIALGFSTWPLRSDRLGAARAEVAGLKDGYLGATWMLLDIDALRKQLQSVDRLLAEARIQLPNESDRTFPGVRPAAKARGLRLDVLAPAKEDWLQEYFAQTPARIVVTGHYHQVGAFLADLDRLPAGMRIDPFVIERSSQPGMVTLKGVLFAYRYLSDEEYAAERKQAEEKQKAEGAKK